MSPSPNVFLAAASQRTKRIRLGALVLTLGMYHPIRAIEEICMVDALSGGRLELGVGRGISPIELGFYGLTPELAQEIYGETIQIVLQGLKSGRVSFKGQHFDFADVPIEVAPIQKSIPLWYGVTRPDTAAWAAKNKINIVCNGSTAAARAIVSRFKSEWSLAGNDAAEMPLAGMSRHIVVADTDAEALEPAKAAYERWFASLTYLWRRHAVPFPLSFPAQFEEANAAGFCLIGSAATVRDKLKVQASEADISYLLCRLAFGDLSLEQTLRSVELLRSEVMPAFEEVHEAV